MNVLSLFDGMGCARIALDRANITITNYYASEIDKFAIKVSKNNYPDIIQLGNVKDISFFGLPYIDLLIGGSPCQGFSFAGKQLNFDDERSKLFFEYVRVLKEIKPKYFILENVLMKKEYQNIISQHLEIEPIMINSSLVSAQNRKRLYWTNIPNLTQPQDKHILLKDIIEDNTMINPASIVGRRLNENGVRDDYNKNIPIKQCLQVKHNSDKSQCLTTVEKDNVLTFLPKGRYPDAYEKINCIQIGNAGISNRRRDDAVYSVNGKNPTIMANSGGQKEPKISEDNLTWRKLTPIECERLQTVPDNYTAHVSNSQRYKMLGNGFTVDVIAHILSNINKE